MTPRVRLILARILALITVTNVLVCWRPVRFAIATANQASRSC